MFWLRRIVTIVIKSIRVTVFLLVSMDNLTNASWYVSYDEKPKPVDI